MWISKRYLDDFRKDNIGEFPLLFPTWVFRQYRIFRYARINDHEKTYLICG